MPDRHDNLGLLHDGTVLGLLDSFFIKSTNPADEGWQQVGGYDAWSHPETGCVVSGHQMRVSLLVGVVPRSQQTYGPWL